MGDGLADGGSPARSRMKNIAILGSTGSIGSQAVEIIRDHPDKFRAVALAAGKNIERLESQIRALSPRLVAVSDELSAGQLRRQCSDLRNLEILTGEEGLKAVAVFPDSDVVLSSIVGAAGLEATLAALQIGKFVGLANKESLVAAGALMVRSARESGATILPVDSEHSAIYQCLEGRRPAEIRRVILTASGGALRRRPIEELASVSPQEALNHPNWAMGPKITVDSATLMNKGLEVIEARWLFDLPASKIAVVVHPQSIVHSLVEFVDGTLLAQLSRPDMKAPIGYALGYPERLENMVRTLDLVTVGTLTFETPSMERYPCLGLAYEALENGGTYPAAMNAANEVAVEAYLGSRIPFTRIAEVVREVMSRHSARPGDTLPEIRQALADAGRSAQEYITRCSV